MAATKLDCLMGGVSRPYNGRPWLQPLYSVVMSARAGTVISSVPASLQIALYRE